MIGILPPDDSAPSFNGGETVGLPVQPSATTGIGDTVGPYRLLEKLGEGGFGSVYLAEQTKPIRRQVALKVIKLGMDTEHVVARFEAERQALALMNHPNIARVLDAGATDTGRPFFVMELVRGVPITEYCETHQLLIRDRLKLFIEVCQAVQHAHQKGIIHRDLKPSNIIVTSMTDAEKHHSFARPASATTPETARPLPKVIDFGIAKATQMELAEKTIFTQTNQFLGTPAYMSPEQMTFSAVDVDTRSDVYSLGVLLYELLTGSTPLDTDQLSYDQVCRRIREEEPPRPSTRLKAMTPSGARSVGLPCSADRADASRRIRRDLDHVVMKALAKDRNRRYETAAELALDLGRHLNDEPVLAVPPSSFYRLQKMAKRNRGVFVAVAAVFVALILGVSLTTWQALRATRSEREQSRLLRESRAQTYVADMNLAQQAFSVHNLGRTRNLLDRHRPAANLAEGSAFPDLRGWEWRYLWQQSRVGARIRLCQTSQAAFSLSVSADGQWLAVGERLGGLAVWDWQRRQKIATLRDDTTIVRAAFSPKEPLLAFSAYGPEDSGNSAFSVSLWNGAAREIVGTLPLNGGCAGLAFSSDGTRLVTFAEGSENQIAIWAMPQGTLLASSSTSRITGLTQGHGAAISGDFTAAAHSLESGRVRLFDPTTGAERWTAATVEQMVMALEFSADGKILAAGTGLDNGLIYLWNVETGEEIAHWEAHRGFISRLIFWPDGTQLASAGADQTVGIWDLANLPDMTEPRRLSGHERPLLDLCLLPDNTTLASSGEDGAVLLWDAATKPADRTHVVLAGAILGWRFDADSQSVLTADAKGQITQWQGSAFQEKHVLLETERETRIATFSKDLRWVATCSPEGNVGVWDLITGKLLAGYPTETEALWPLSLISQGAGLLLYDHKTSKLIEWELPSGQEIRSWESTLRFGVGLLSPDEQWLVRVQDPGHVILTERGTHRDIALDPIMPGTQGAAFSADGEHVAVTSFQGFARVWETATGREVTTLRGFLMGVHSAAFSPDGKRLATTSTGAEAVKLWDMESLQELLTLPADNVTFISTQFSPDGNILGAMDYLKTLHLWRAPSRAEIEAAELSGLQ